MINKSKRPTSPARAAASARNGRLSRGAATFEGRRKMLEANTRHGFFASAALLASEDPAPFNALTEALLLHYQPADEYEIRLVRGIAKCAWRLERFLDMQTADLQHSINRQAPKSTATSTPSTTKLAPPSLSAMSTIPICGMRLPWL